MANIFGTPQAQPKAPANPAAVRSAFSGGSGQSAFGAVPPPASLYPTDPLYQATTGIYPGLLANPGTAPAPSPTGTPPARGPNLAPLPPPTGLQDPGNNFTNPGYGEQAVNLTQNRLLEDPFSSAFQQGVQNAQNPTQGENFLNQNLGTLSGPGQGDQYWNQVQGQFNGPFAGESFARQQSQAMAPTGASGAFFNQAMGNYDQFTGFQGAGNTQGQYGQSAASLAGGTQGEQGLGQIAGQYGNIGQYNGANQAQGQYQQNAQSGPLAGQQFYNQVAGQAGTTGRYSDPNLAAGQYSQTQQAFGDLPVANFDPFYDRAEQLGVQNYNRQAAGRGVYGSSEALSGVGNVITDIEAQRANRGFDAEMQRAQEQRARQGLLGEQARMGDLSSLAGFGANLAGLETFGNLANQAGNQTLGQQTMLGNQARQADVSATDAFNQNLQGAQTFANINNQQGQLELERNRTLGDMANAADSQALGAQNSNISGLNAFNSAASNADTAETNRFTARTNAMNQADQTAINRLQTGADIAFRGDENARNDFTAQSNAAQQAGNMDIARQRLGADIANSGSNNDLNRLNSFNNQSQGAEQQRQARLNSTIDAVSNYSRDVQNVIGQNANALFGEDRAAAEDAWKSDIAPKLQEAGLDQQQIQQIYDAVGLGIQGVAAAKGGK